MRVSNMNLNQIETALLLKQADANAEVVFWEGIRNRIIQTINNGAEASRIYAKLNNDDLIEVALTLTALWSMKLKSLEIGGPLLVAFCEGHNKRADAIAEEIRKLSKIATEVASQPVSEYAELSKPKRITKISTRAFRTRKDGSPGQLVEDVFRYRDELWISQSHLACLACMSPRSGIFDFLDFTTKGGLLRAASGSEIGANTERVLISDGWLELQYAAYLQQVRDNMVCVTEPY